MDLDPSHRSLLEDFVAYKLGQRGLSHPPPPPHPSPLPHPHPHPAQMAMRAAVDEFERRFSRSFSPLSSQLHVTPSSARQRLLLVAGELFGPSPGADANWGRLVAFFALGAALCQECVLKEMPHLVEQLVGCMADYLDQHLRDWIQRNGGWRQFVVLYGNGGSDASQKLGEGYWSSLKTVVTGAITVGAFLSLGAFFGSK
ncbi:LOW QUALITY PROTEIN: bcl-2-like protein 2 [Carcharodon carcharias]|uniref:LOW QUALITY PROTEIN: bcl-2-like protein 2 n=1 Tax=Carcharodon carcharias TaxID=13397 RepID=UPI001B7DE936|nr:LOW QUALITY PROTEIN: bcl-2-like protein 2 [Carcharodon carcharias]